LGKSITGPSLDESVDREAYENNADIQLELERLRELEEVQVLINKLDFEDPFTAEEFVLYDDSEITTEMISDEEILKAVQPNNQEKEEIEEEPLPIITHNEVIECYDKVILYLQRWEKNYIRKFFRVQNCAKMIKNCDCRSAQICDPAGKI
jgi:hypothetical protein